MKKFPIRRLLLCASAIVAAAILVPARADTFPSKTVRLVVIVPPGGSADSVARILAQGLSIRLGQAVVVENRGGAGGNLASAHVARAAADGYTLLVTSNNHTINPLLSTSAGYNVDDFAAVALLWEGPSVISVPANSSFSSLRDLLSEASKKPDSIGYGTSGVGLSPHMSMEVLQRMANVKLVHVSYPGSGPSVLAAIGGHVPVVISSLSAATPSIDAGKLRALAVTSAKRWPSAPTIPAVAEAGIPGFESMNWLGLFAPKGTPAAIVQRIHAEVNTVLADEANKGRVANLGGGMVSLRSVDAFTDMIRKDHELSIRMVKEAAIQVEK